MRNMETFMDVLRPDACSSAMSIVIWRKTGGSTRWWFPGKCVGVRRWPSVFGIRSSKPWVPQVLGTCFVVLLFRSLRSAQCRMIFKHDALFCYSFVRIYVPARGFADEDRNRNSSTRWVSETHHSRVTIVARVLGKFDDKTSNRFLPAQIALLT